MSENQYTFGRFVWRELLTDNVEGAKGFYGELLGWTFKGSDMGPMGTYWLCHAGEAQVAGIMQKPANLPAPPHWAGYVSVDDVDAALARAKEAGGQVPMPPMEVPDVGRMGVLLDPAGAVSWAFKSARGDLPIKRPAPGEFCWESLAATDIKAAVAFYQKVYPWKASEFQGMTVFGTGEGMENQVADVNAAPPGVPSHWLSNVVVADLSESRGRVAKLGGKVLMEEIVVPNIGKIAVVQDPQGATLALFQPAT